MPHVVTELEDAVDEAAGTKTMALAVRSRPHPVCSRPPRCCVRSAQEVAFSSLDHGDAVAIGLIEHACRSTPRSRDLGERRTMPLGVFLLTAAIKKEQAGAFHRARLPGMARPHTARHAQSCLSPMALPLRSCLGGSAYTERCRSQRAWRRGQDSAHERRRVLHEMRRGNRVDSQRPDTIPRRPQRGGR